MFNEHHCEDDNSESIAEKNLHACNPRSTNSTHISLFCIDTKFNSTFIFREREENIFLSIMYAHTHLTSSCSDNELMARHVARATQSERENEKRKVSKQIRKNADEYHV